MHSIAAFPLRIGAARIGALTVYDSRPRALEGDRLDDAFALTAVVARTLVALQVADADGDLVPRLSAGTSVAAGVVARRLRFDPSRRASTSHDLQHHRDTQRLTAHRKPTSMASREALLASTFLTVADTLVDDFDVVEELGTLCGRCVGLLGASASGILLADPRDALPVMATSGEQASLLELF
jgi:hypothetical protein